VERDTRGKGENFSIHILLKKSRPQAGFSCVGGRRTLGQNGVKKGAD